MSLLFPSQPEQHRSKIDVETQTLLTSKIPCKKYVLDIYIYIKDCHAIQVLTQIKPGLGYTWFLHDMLQDLKAPMTWSEYKV